MIWHSSTAQEVLDNFNVDATIGLDNDTVAQRLDKYKENEIHTLKQNKLLNILLYELKGKFNIFILLT